MHDVTCISKSISCGYEEFTFMKEHTIWFWLYWGLWGAFSLNGMVQNPVHGDFAGFLGQLSGAVIFGYIFYRIGKWIFDYKK